MRAIGRFEPREQARRAAVEFDHIEAVARLQPGQRVAQGLACLLHRGAVHRAGGIDDEGHIARFTMPLQRISARWRQHQQGIGLALVLLGEQRRARRPPGLRRPHQLEVAVGGYRPLGQRDMKARAVGVAGLLDAYRVITAAQIGQRHTGAQVDGQADRIDGALPGALHRRRDLRCIRDLIGVGRPATGQGDLFGNRLTGDITRRHHHRKAQGEHPIAVGHRLLVLDLDTDLAPGVDIGHRGGEDIRPLLLDQAGPLAGGLGRLIGLACLGLGLDIALDNALTDPHAQLVDRRVLRQRKDINALGPAVAGVAEGLRDRHPRGHRDHLHPHPGIEHRRRHRRDAILGRDQQGTVADLRHRAGGAEQQCQYQGQYGPGRNRVVHIFLHSGPAPPSVARKSVLAPVQHHSNANAAAMIGA